MSAARVAISLVIVMVFAVAGLTIWPAGYEAGTLLNAQDDPVVLADRALARGFSAEVATREIEAALATDDADMAQSFLELARDRNIALDPVLVTKVEDANAALASATRGAGNFARGLITGEPDDLAGLAGTALGDFFVFGDVRDVVREGTRLASGQPVDELVLGLAGVGLAVTAGTYVTVGGAAPVRIGLTVVKAARKTGRLSVRMTEWIGRSLREMIDLPVLRRAIAGATVSEPLVAIRAARTAVKLEKGEDLMRLVGDVGRTQSRAGTKAALDGLKLAEGPRDMARIARLADAKGGKTRAILKFLGRGAIALTVAAFDLSLWVLWAALTIFGFIASTKAAVERVTWRALQRGKVRRAKRELERLRRLATAPSQV